MSFSTALRIANIIIPSNRRPVRDGDVRRLAESIRELGLINPITVQPDDKSKKLVLVTGANRLAACKSLGWKEIAGFVVSYDTLLCDLAEIDENLCRAELTPGQRAEATARRKSIWERLHPEATVAAKRAEGGKMAGRGRPKGPLEHSGANSPSFVNDTASKTGRSTASVRRDAQIGEALLASPDAAEVVHSSPKPIAQSELLAIAQAKPEERKAAAEKAVEKAKAPKARRQVHPNVSKKNSPAIPPSDMAPKAPAVVEPPPVAAEVTSWRITLIRAGGEYEARFDESTVAGHGATSEAALAMIATRAWLVTGKGSAP